MKKHIKYLILFFFVFITSIYSAQTISRLPCIDKKFSIVIHVVKDSNWQGRNYGLFGMMQPSVFKPLIKKTIDSLNNHFAPICVSFDTCEVKYIENYWYLDLSTQPGYQQKAEEMEGLYNLEHRINLYYVRNTGLGQAYVDDTITNIDSGAIFLSDYITVKTLVQAMGQYFGLATTNKIAGELVDGSNWALTGDKIKDTPADPGIVLPTSLIGCRYAETTLKDANNQFYNPIVGNAMSVYDPTCMCKSPHAFTNEQYLNMANTYLSNPGMW